MPGARLFLPVLLVFSLIGPAAHGAAPVVMTFDCDTEGFTIQQGDTFGGTLRQENDDGHGKLVITHNAARQDPLDSSVDYSLISRNLVVSTADYDRVAMGITINGVAETDTVPFVLVTYVDGDLMWLPDQRVPGGTSVFRFNPGTNANWDGGNTNILRFDIARLGELPAGFDHSRVSYEIDWIAVYSSADNPGFVPAEQDTHPECLPAPVPDTRGMTEADAVAALGEKHFVAGIRRVPSDAVPEGHVIAQQPPGGVLAKARSIVAITVSQPYRQYRVAEFAFTAAQDHTGTASTLQFDVHFTDPEGTVYDVPGFWDGGLAWKARLNPLTPGDWTYTTTAPGDAGLNEQAGAFTVLPANGANPLYRHGGVLRVSDDHRYLTHTDGTPFFWLGDTWWFCPGTLTPLGGSSNPAIDSAFRHLIDHRTQQGFSVVQMAFLSSGEMVNPDADPDYGREMDYYMAYANDAGIVPVIGLTFHSGMDQKTLAEWERRWRYVIARVGAYDVTWLITGEYNANNGPLEERIPKVMALGQFIKDTDPYHRAMTVHPWAFSVETREAWDQPWYDFIMLQGGHGNGPGVTGYQQARNHLPTRPVLEGECRYDHIRGFDAADVREVAYRALQAGCFGYTYGAHGIWYPTQNREDDMFWHDWGVSPPWWEALLYPGGDQMGYLKALYTALEWWRLEPRPDAASHSEVLVTGDGTRVLLVHFPRGLAPSTAVTVQGAAASSVYRATWFDPRTGAFAPLAEALTSVAGTLNLPARADSQDWMLILRDLDEPVEVPDVTGYPRTEAGTRLRARGLLAEYTGYDGGDGFVAEQDPGAGTTVSPESTVVLHMTEGEDEPAGFHEADTDRNGRLDVSEVLRVIQLYQWGGFQCAANTLDGYGPGSGGRGCLPHTADYAPEDWRLSLPEVLRVVQLASFDGITPCANGEDGYCGR